MPLASRSASRGRTNHVRSARLVAARPAPVPPEPTPEPVFPGSVAKRVRRETVAAPYEVVDADHVLDVTGTGGVVLPSPVDGRELQIAAVDGVVTIDGDGATLNGSPSHVLYAQDAVTLVGNGTHWRFH